MWGERVGLQERQAAEHALRVACAELSQWLSRQVESGDAAFAYTVIGLQRRTLGVMLGHALDHRAWGDAAGIVRALDEPGKRPPASPCPPPCATGSPATKTTPTRRSSHDR